jgi:hypothetical protein
MEKMRNVVNEKRGGGGGVLKLKIGLFFKLIDKKLISFLSF